MSLLSREEDRPQFPGSTGDLKGVFGKLAETPEGNEKLPEGDGGTKDIRGGRLPFDSGNGLLEFPGFMSGLTEVLEREDGESSSTMVSKFGFEGDSLIPTAKPLKARLGVDPLDCFE